MEINTVIPKQVKLSTNPAESYLKLILIWINTDGDNYIIYVGLKLF